MGPADSGAKLSSFLSQHLEGKYSARSIKRAIEQNNCQINGRTERFASTIVGTGDHILLNLETLSEASLPDRTENDRVIFEDEALLVYDKPAGVNCDENGVMKLLKKEDCPLMLVHRLDRETTGVLLLAKNRQIFESLVDQFKCFQVHKRYLAIVDGLVARPRGIIENHLGKKHAYAGQTIWGEVKATEGLLAKTEWHCLSTGKEASYLVCMPKTGRTHQIRVHMAEMGHPILGDFQYGKEFHCMYRPARILLHAEEIRLRHPLTGRSVSFNAPLPDDFIHAQQELFKG